jgi:hypothetical protein
MAVLLMLVYNAMRFGTPFDFGYGFVQGNTALAAVYQKYGGVNIHYMPCNLYISMFGMPYIAGKPIPGTYELCWQLASLQYDSSGHLIYLNPIGMSIFLTTPAFFYIFKAHLNDPLVKAAWIGIVCVMVPLWMYYNTGFLQFGYRYILDVIVFLFILLAVSIKKVRWTEMAAILSSVLINFVGMTMMFSVNNQINWIQMWVSLIRGIFH